MTPPVEKVRRLIALAVGTSAPEEARTAALTAVRLINEHKLLDAPTPPAHTPRGGADPGATWWNDVVARAAENVRRQRERAEAPPPPPPPPPRRERCATCLRYQCACNAPKPAWDPKEWKRPEAPPGCMWAKAAMRKACLHCGQPVELGEDVLWEKGCGYFHARCWREVVK